MPVVAQVDRKVAAALQRAGLAETGARLVVGVSGGADSSALLYSLYHLRESLGFSLHVAHLNHDFRGEEADEDARFVETMAQELGLPFSAVKQDPIRYQHEHHISSFEQGAREMRYRFLADVAHRVGAPAVAVGHTSDDLAETVLLHIMRGAGLHGLRGMSETAPWPWPAGLDTPIIFRPLLETTKAETVEYCNELGRPYRQDSGNLLFKFTRNRVRQQLLPLMAEEYNPRVQDALVRLASSASLDLDYMESELERAWKELAAPGEGDGETPGQSVSATLIRRAFDGLHPALKRRALRRAYVTVKGDARRLAETHLRSMIDFASPHRSPGRLDLPEGISLRLSNENITLSRAATTADCPFPHLPDSQLQLPGGISSCNVVHFFGEWQVIFEPLKPSEIPDFRQPDNFTAYFGQAVLESSLEVRKRQDGDRFQPLGMAQTKRLHNFFIDEKVPREWRDRVPLLVGDQGVAWVVGYRIAEWAKVPDDRTADTPVLRVRFTRISE